MFGIRKTPSLFIKLPELESPEAREALLEQARYEAFRERGASQASTLFAVFITVTAILAAIALAMLLRRSAVFADSGVVSSALVIALLVYGSYTLGTLAIQFERAKRINRKITEIQNRQNRD